MKAAIHTTYGPPSVMSIADMPKPIPKSNEVLIKVHASTVNRTDTGFRSAEYVISRLFSGLLKPKRPVLGNEYAGVIEAVGGDVTEFKSGDKVFGFDDTAFGSNAEYMTTKASGMIDHMPKTLHFDDASVLTEGSHYALTYIRAAKLQAGQTVLLNGATGAIGSAALQILKSMGVTVIAVCNTKNVKLITRLGADAVIDYETQDFAAICHDQGMLFDAVFDAVGKSTFRHCKPLLKPRGVYMSSELGPWSQNPLYALWTPLFRGKKVLFPIPKNRREDVTYIKELIESGKYMPVVDRIYALDQIVDAHTYVESGQKTGSVVLKI